MKTLSVTMAVMLAWLVASPAMAVPALQLDILGGTYDASPDEESIITTSDVFTVYALGKKSKVDLADTFMLSIALVPMTGPGDAALGSFDYTIDGGSTTTVNATSDMTYGVPPLESDASHDGGDLSKHGIFETFFVEIPFLFDAGMQSGEYNVQDDPGIGPQAGSALYYRAFDIDASLLALGYDLHFDLYSTKAKRNGDIDIDLFAPFSHDAGTHREDDNPPPPPPGVAMPEPTTAIASLIALTGLALRTTRRR